MAVGDDAQAGGLPIVPETGEAGRLRWGALEINRTRDFVALVKAAIPVGKPGFRAASGITYSTAEPIGGSDGDIHYKIALGVVTTYVKHNGIWVLGGGGSGTGGEGSYAYGVYIPYDTAGNASAPRPTTPSDVNFIWFNSPSEPVNLGPLDLWSQIGSVPTSGVDSTTVATFDVISSLDEAPAVPADTGKYNVLLVVDEGAPT
jgi:hypothetical protein